METHSFQKVSGDSPETLGKLYVSTKHPHQEIRWDYGIFFSFMDYLYQFGHRAVIEVMILFFKETLNTSSIDRVVVREVDESSEFSHIRK